MRKHKGARFSFDGDADAHVHRLGDINGVRLQKMSKLGHDLNLTYLTGPGYIDDFGVEFCILSLTAPGVQATADRKEAEDKATLANNWIANEIKTHPDRFGAFCTLSMHDPRQAADELERCVTELGMLGAIINDYQATGTDGEDLIFYDGPEWDVFWTRVTELDVPCK
jgi:predicted TIM-barrel fold metal-dependent hydrolase